MMLLEDCLQKRAFAIFRERVSKGELIEFYDYNQYIVIYSEPPIFVDFEVDQVKFVEFSLLPYLLAVENLDSRYNMLINKYNSLKNNVLLNVGDKVDVLMEQQVIPTAGIVKYKGNLPGKTGIFFGIEILVS